jgi:hypothetical protein
MLTTTSKILADLDDRLNFIKSESNNPMKIAELSIESIIKYINKLKLFIVNYNFKNEKEEILFFKKIKPQFIAKYIYYAFIFSVESKRPHGCSKMVLSFLEEEHRKMHLFREDNMEFCRYFRAENNHLDHLYFVRGKIDFKISLDYYSCKIDERFCTHHDELVSKILANQLIEEYLKNEIESLHQQINSPVTNSKNTKISSLNWTAPKSAIIEILYAFHTDGCFNNGNVTIKQIATTLVSAFNIDLGHYSRTLLEIRGRKTGKTKYLDNLQEKLLKKLNDTDDEL